MDFDAVAACVCPVGPTEIYGLESHNFSSMTGNSHELDTKLDNPSIAVVQSERWTCHGEANSHELDTKPDHPSISLIQSEHRNSPGEACFS